MKNEEFWRGQARKARDESGLTSAVIVREDRLMGAASAKPRLPWFHRQVGCVRRWFGVPSGEDYWMCPGCAPPQEHAEVRAIRDAAVRGNLMLLRGSTMYVTHWHACEPCAQRTSGFDIKLEFELEEVN